uniref:Trafficking protein particle complex 6b-like n=1 Tax=Neogobius melanostomus TaxID=47308 RepID=A0A8C6S8I1_9GOBI
MADEVLFEFLHMEIVAHVYKEQQGSKGDMDNKERGQCISVLESMGFRVGQGIIERLTRDSPSFKDELDVMKFVCKDFWTKVFRRQVDNLRTNHQVNILSRTLSNGKQYLDQAPKYLAFSCGVVRGALSNLGLESVVTAEVSIMPSCKYDLNIKKTISSAVLYSITNLVFILLQVNSRL